MVRYVQYYHTISEDYHDNGPNGQYKLVTETRVKSNVKLLKLNYEVLHRKVKVHHTDDKGKVKKLTEQYVVNEVFCDRRSKSYKGFRRFRN